MARWARGLWDQASGRATDHCCERRWNRYFAVVDHGAGRKCDGWDDSQDDKNLIVIPLIGCRKFVASKGVHKIAQTDRRRHCSKQENNSSREYVCFILKATSPILITLKVLYLNLRKLICNYANYPLHPTFRTLSH